MAKKGIVSEGIRFVKCILPEVMRPIRTLWHEIIGFLFIVLALIGLRPAIIRLIHFDGDARTFFELLLIAGFMLVMGGYGVSSFRRARKASRS